MQWAPHVTVAAIAKRESAFLFIEEESGGRVVLNQPAGHLEANESLLDAVKRETLEETAWQFVPEALVGIYRWSPASQSATYLRFVFCGQVHDHDPNRSLDRGIIQALWLSYGEIQQQRNRLRGPQVLACIEDYRLGRRFALDLLQDLGGFELLDHATKT